MGPMRSSINRRTTHETELALGAGAVLAIAPFAAEACSRAVFFSEDGQTVTGRRMDRFVSDTDTNLWLYLPWLERDSNTATPMTWTSRDGSLVTSVYEGPVVA